MEFEDNHEEEEEEDEDMAVTPPYKTSTDLNNNNNNINMNNNNMIAVKKHMSPATTTASTRYRECLKNHAVTIGGHAVDGCGEFMPAGAEGTLDSIRCAACNCHRNFHRKEFSDNYGKHPHQLTIYTPRPHPSSVSFPFYPYSRTTAAAPETTITPPPSGPPGYLHVSNGGHPTRPLALPSPNQNHHNSSNNDINNSCVSEAIGDDNEMTGGSGGGMSSSSGKKRFRTKFTAEQKDKMLALAEKLGWRIQKKDEAIVQHFCEESGVKPHVLKVWMHNNKHTRLGRNPNHDNACERGNELECA